MTVMPDPAQRRRLRVVIVWGGAVLLAALIIALTIYVLVFLPAILVRPEPQLEAKDRISAENGVRTAGIAALVALGGAASVIFTARTYTLGLRSYGLTRGGQLADRFTKAIEQVGRESMSARIGGVFALEQVAREDSVYVDAVVGVANAMVRDRSPRDVKASPDGHVNDHAADIREDIVAALGVIKRLQPMRKGRCADFRNTELAGYELVDFDLRRALFNGADLRGAKLQGSDVSGADFRGALLEGADFTSAIVTRASFDPGQLSQGQLGPSVKGADTISEDGGNAAAGGPAEHS